VLADNKLALNAGWNPDILAVELQDLIEMDVALELTGFETAQIDIILDAASEKTLLRSGGAILFTRMDWRHIGELLAAGDEVGLELKNLRVWNKDDGAWAVLQVQARAGLHVEIRHGASHKHI
jgi:hypothetical protein